MEIKVNHSLPIEEAKKRILKLGDELKKEYGNQLKDYTENWNGNNAEISFKTLGIKIKGFLEISDKDVTVSGKLPLLARPYKSQIENLIKEKLVELLQ